MSPATAAPPSALECLHTLAERFRAEDMDVPGGEARIRLEVADGTDLDALISMADLALEPPSGRPDATIAADAETWATVAEDVSGGMAPFQAGRLRIRRNLHLGIGFLAATAGSAEPGRLRFDRVETANHDFSILEAGEGEPLICLHGLGGTKASFMTTVGEMAPRGNRVIAVDLPGFGDSGKPVAGRYDAGWYADAVVELLDELGIERASFACNSMGGRIALELGIRHRERVEHLVLFAPALAWLKERPWRRLLALPLPRLGLLQPTPRWAVEPVVRRLVPGGDSGWVAAGVDEFLRSYLTPSGRFAFYECARNIYMDEPYGEDGLWTRLKKLEPRSLFVWGEQDTLVPNSFMRHVERTIPHSDHLELDCGHVPQMECPERAHEAVHEFLAG